MTARLTITQAGPQVSIQDAGRFGMLRFGVPASGPMDRFAFAIANAALRNAATAPAIEVSLGGLTLQCTKGPVSFCTAGGNFRVSIDTEKAPGWCVGTLETGQILTIQRGRWGSWCYLAFAGALQSNQWLGSASTHGPTGLGGGQLIKGAEVQIAGAKTNGHPTRALICPVTARPRHIIRVVMGPQDRYFDESTQRAFLSEPFTLTDAYDRMGVRLSGPLLMPNKPLDMPSEPVMRGSVQIAGDGIATVLLADHQTTGGYPKIATVLSDDLNGFLQLRSREMVRFESVEPAHAISTLRTQRRMHDAFLAGISRQTI